MIFSGCQGKPKAQLLTKICPECGAEVELMSTDTEAVCERCGQTIYNDTLSCVKWCEHARECVWDAMYEYMMKKLRDEEDELDMESLIAEAGEIGRTY